MTGLKLLQAMLLGDDIPIRSEAQRKATAFSGLRLRVQYLRIFSSQGTFAQGILDVLYRFDLYCSLFMQQCWDGLMATAPILFATALLLAAYVSMFSLTVLHTVVGDPQQQVLKTNKVVI